MTNLPNHFISACHTVYQQGTTLSNNLNNYIKQDMTMKKLILAAALTFSFNTFAEQATIDRIDDASNTLNTETLTTLTQSSQGYDQAYANYRLGLAYMVKQQTSKVIEHLSQATKTLEAQLKAQWRQYYFGVRYR